MCDRKWTTHVEGGVIHYFVYHDTQDPANPGWAYRIMYYEDGVLIDEESGPIDDPDDIPFPIPAE